MALSPQWREISNTPCARGTKDLLSIVYHDPIGQLLQQTSLGALDAENHSKYLRNLSSCNIIWAVVPLRIFNGEPTVRDDEIEIVQSYVAESINARIRDGTTAPVSLAIVISRIDAMGQYSEQEARSDIVRLVNEVGKKFERLAVKTDLIWSCVVFPVSAFGFNNHALQSSATKDGSQEQHYLLAGPTMRPWNLDKLLLWSLCIGLEQPTGHTIFRRARANSDLASRVGDSLSRTEGPFLTLKAGNARR